MIFLRKSSDVVGCLQRKGVTSAFNRNNFSKVMRGWVIWLKKQSQWDFCISKRISLEEDVFLLHRLFSPGISWLCLICWSTASIFSGIGIFLGMYCFVWRFDEFWVGICHIFFCLVQIIEPGNDKKCSRSYSIPSRHTSENWKWSTKSSWCPSLANSSYHPKLSTRYLIIKKYFILLILCVVFRLQ